jgi:Tfp pilus assembly protein PilN
MLLVVAAGASFFLAWHYAVLVREFDAVESERARLQSPGSGVPHELGAEDKTRLRSEMRFARRVIEQLDTPWPALFAAVETAYDDNVTLLGVEPEPERREVRLLAEAKDAEAMLAYVRQVRQSPVLKDAWLANHQINLQDPLHPVRFTINASWLSPSVEPLSTEVVTNDTHEGATADAGKVIAGDVRGEVVTDANQDIADDTREEETTDAGQQGEPTP